MSSKHPQRELSVFTAFASICGLRVISESIEKRDSPEPDILCQIEGEGPVAFELVELLDQARIARPRGIQDEIMDGFRNGFRRMPEGEQAKMREQLGNATVRVRMSPAVSSQKRRAAIGEILKLLLDTDAQLAEEFRLPPKLSEIASLEIVRGNFDGPRFTAVSGGSYDPIPHNSLSTKLRKVYKSAAPIELLAYFDSQHAPLESQISDLSLLIESSIGASVFRRVWVYDANNCRICSIVKKP